MPTTTGRLGRSLGALTLAGLLGLTSACGGGSGDSGTNGGQSDSGQGSSSSGPEKLSSDEFAQTMVDAQREAGSYHMVVTSESKSSGKSTMEADVELDGSTSNVKATTPPGTAQPMEMILIGTDMYMKSDALSTQGKWAHIDLSQQKDGLFGMAAQQLDQTKALKIMADPKKFTAQGTETVQGTETMHYSVVLGKDAYAQALPSPELAKLLPETIPFELWLDKENRPVRMTQELTLDMSQLGQGNQTTTTDIVFTDYGQDVSIDAPPASQVSEGLPGMPGAPQ